MLKITNDIADALQDCCGLEIGCYHDDYGAIIGENNQFVIFMDQNGTFLAHRSEFDFSDDGVFVRLKHPEMISKLPNLEDVIEVKEFRPDD